MTNRRLSELLGVPRESITAETTMSGLLAHCVQVGTLSNRNAERITTHLDHHISGSSDADPTIETQGSRAFEFTVEVMKNGGSVVLVEDITERKNAEAKISHMARYDALTGLPNRTFFHDQLEGALIARRTLDSCAVLFIDLDQFKQVNDTLGHPAGDELLCAVAERLRGIVRDTDLVARFGGDEFVCFPRRDCGHAGSSRARRTHRSELGESTTSIAIRSSSAPASASPSATRRDHR